MLEAYAREELSPAKRPKRWSRLPEIPRTLTGKVLRRDLPEVTTRTVTQDT